MNVLMYPLGPDDNFPDEFCAIRQGGGELTFYTPEGESASWMLFRAESENAKLREELEQWHRLTAGIELPEYPVTEFHPKNLERENAKLRERVAELEGLIDDRRYVPQEWYALVQSENAKLRELAQRMFDVISSRNSWWDGTCKDTEHFACLMRDLGIEVDE